MFRNKQLWLQPKYPTQQQKLAFNFNFFERKVRLTFAIYFIKIFQLKIQQNSRQNCKNTKEHSNHF